MENLIEYLDESLVPLEKKIKEYLHVEQEIRRLELELLMITKADSNNEEGTLNNIQQQLDELLKEYHRLKKEVIEMLPEKNKFIEINLGYGPSMVGYFTVDHETHQPLPEPLLRVVH